MKQRRVHVLLIADEVLAVAAGSVLAAAGHDVARDDGTTTEADKPQATPAGDTADYWSTPVFVCDLSSPPRSPAVLVAPPVAAACRGVLDAFADGAALGAVLTDDIARLPQVVAMVAEGLACFTPRLVELARLVPNLDSRQAAVLAAVAEGSSIPQLAVRLHVSSATAKRELAALFDLFDVGSRVELVLAASRLGVIDDRGALAPGFAY